MYVCVCLNVALSADLLYKQPRHSWYCEPAKSDYDKDKFRHFTFGMYNKQFLKFRKQYEKTKKIPHGFIWNPENVDQKKSNSLYMHLEVLLLAIFCIHHRYEYLNINLYDLLQQLLSFESISDGISKTYNIVKPIKARRIKQLKFKNGATNAMTITTGDFGFTKPAWYNKQTQTCEHYNQYGKVVGVKL